MTDEELRGEFTNLVNLIESVKNETETLATRVDDGFRSLGERLDRQYERLERHGGLLRTGQLWVSRHDKWREHIDSTLDQQAVELQQLRDRLRELEKGKGQ